MLDRLIELTHIVSSTKSKQIEVVGTKSNNNTLFQRFYKGLQSGAFATDEEAAKALYDSLPDNKAYKKLKSRLERRLLNTLFHIDVNNPQFNDQHVAYYTCYRNFAAISILGGRAAHLNTVALAERTLRIAIAYEFTLIAYELARILTNYFVGKKVEAKKYRHYVMVGDEQFAILQAERKSERYKLEIVFAHAGRRSNDESLLPAAIEYTKELKELHETYTSYRFRLNAFNVYCMRYELANDYEKVVQESEAAIRYFRNKSSDAYHVALAVFLHKQGSHYMILRQYEKAEAKILEAISYVVKGVPNWFICHEQYIILCFHSHQYQKAYDILIKVMTHKHFKRMHPQSKELWAVYEAYVHYFIRRRKIIIPENGAVLKPFRLGKFINSVPIHSKDKRGVNVAILILQVLFLLEDKKYDIVIDRIENLEKYVYVRLYNDETYRSNCFVKMLGAMVRAQFNKVATIRRAADYHKKLVACPLEKSKQASNVEIVPYEDLWENVITSVQEKFWYSKNK